MHFYAEQGYPKESVLEYLMTIANSDFEDWRRTHPDDDRSSFPFNLKKMSVSGALFDMNKLNDVSKNVISRMTAEEVSQKVLAWAEKYDSAFYNLLVKDKNFTTGIFNIDRENAKPRKDLAKWSDARDYTAYFFEETFEPTVELPETVSSEDAKAIINAYLAANVPTEDKQVWFEAVKALCPALGFSPDVKAYKQNPDAFKGHVGDVSTVLRLAVTGRRNTPDLCAIMNLLGSDRVKARLTAFSDSLTN